MLVNNKRSKHALVKIAPLFVNLFAELVVTDLIAILFPSKAFEQLALGTLLYAPTAPRKQQADAFSSAVLPLYTGINNTNSQNIGSSGKGKVCSSTLLNNQGTRNCKEETAQAQNCNAQANYSEEFTA
jgi:hypothetical protein